MKKSIVIFLFCFSIPMVLTAQHFSYEPSFISNDMIWNPGSTAERDYLEYGVFYRQQWTGFRDAPRTIMAHAEYPFLYNNMSVGGYFYGDRSGIVDYFKAGFNYAYKMKLGRRRHDQIAVGVGATISQFKLANSRIVSNGPEDPIIFNADFGGINPDLDLGFMYISDNRVKTDRSYWYFGLSGNSLINGTELFRNNDQSMAINGNLHANALVGISQVIPVGRFNGHAWYSFTTNHSYRVGGSLGIEFFEAFTIGVLGASDGSVGLKLGTNVYSPFMGDGFMKLAITGVSNMQVATLGRNPTFEVYLAYSFRTE